MKKKETTTQVDNNWALTELRLEFKRGYEFQKTVDRYEGKISFSNNQGESFTVKLREDMTQPYLDLVAGEIIKNAEDLSVRLKESLIVKKSSNEGI
jgi:hypothetical protein